MTAGTAQLKERSILLSGPMVRAILEGRKTQTRRVVKPAELTDCGEWKCPYGKAGERLWVRETWAVSPAYDSYKPSEMTANGALAQIAYRAGGGFDFEEPKLKWRPSIFMPRWASRLMLEIVSVRVERLREITEKGAVAEGCGGRMSTVFGLPSFYWLWNELNAKRGFGWGNNPWVWVIEFKRVRRSDEAPLQHK